MEVEEQVNQFNSEISEAAENLSESISQVDARLENDTSVEEQLEQLHEDYRNLSRKRANFIAESSDFTPTKPVKPLKQPGIDDYEGKRQLDALEPDLLSHKEFLDGKKEEIMTEAEQVYQEYRRQSHQDDVEPVMDIPENLQELDELRESKSDEISSLRNYLYNLNQVKNGERDSSETDYFIPEDEALVEQQIDAVAEEIYESWREIKDKEERIEDALNQLKEDDSPAISTAIKYGVRPVESSVEGSENLLKDIDRYWTRLGERVKTELPEEYSQRITSA